MDGCKPLDAAARAGDLVELKRLWNEETGPRPKLSEKKWADMTSEERDDFLCAVRQGLTLVSFSA